MSYAALIRPVIDRVYVGLRAASRDRVRAVYEGFGLRPGFESDFYFGLLARPMPADAFIAVTTYRGADMRGELAQGTAAVGVDAAWRLTELGRDLALAVQRAIGDGAEECWARTPIETMPGLAVLPRLNELTGRLLVAGLASGGPALRALPSNRSGTWPTVRSGGRSRPRPTGATNPSTRSCPWTSGSSCLLAWPRCPAS